MLLCRVTYTRPDLAMERRSSQYHALDEQSIINRGARSMRPI
jgi:hypothetical protein